MSVADRQLNTAETRLKLWQGEFGSKYIERNSPDPVLQRKLCLQWAKILRAFNGAPVSSVLEVGANIGLNLRALSSLTDAKRMAVEPNVEAVRRLIADGVVTSDDARVGSGQAIPFEDDAAELVFSSGVLIHIHFDDHEAVCREMLRVSQRYILCVEYFSDQNREVEYRGYNGALFLRDYGRMWMDIEPSLTLMDYGFFYKHAGCADSMNYWLFSK